MTTRGSGEYDPEHWNAAFLKNECDAIRLGKQILADPDTPNKAVSGDWEAIRTCIKCGNCINSGEVMPYELSCAINPGLGRYEKPVERSFETKNVVVIGGGPAGIEAARVSALRGHKVTLIEKNDALGGNLYVASLPISKETFTNYIRWGGETLKRLGVDVRLGTIADVNMVASMNPDTVFVATGSNPAMPPIPGIDSDKLIKAEDVLKGTAVLGKNIIVAGAGEVGLETADLIMVKYKPESLTLIEMRPDLGMDMNPMDKAMLFANPAIYPTHFQNGLRPMVDTRITAFREGGVSIEDQNGNKADIPADSIVLALGYVSEQGLYDKLKAMGVNAIALGDAAQVSKIVTAIYQANVMARDN